MAQLQSDQKHDCPPKLKDQVMRGLSSQSGFYILLHHAAFGGFLLVLFSRSTISAALRSETIFLKCGLVQDVERHSKAWTTWPWIEPYWLTKMYLNICMQAVWLNSIYGEILTQRGSSIMLCECFFLRENPVWVNGKMNELINTGKSCKEIQ